MAGTHVPYPPTTIGGNVLMQATRTLILARQQFQRVKQLADAVSNGGGQTVLLETGQADPTFALPAGTGGTIYTNIANIVAGLNAMTYLSDMDQGG